MDISPPRVLELGAGVIWTLVCVLASAEDGEAPFSFPCALVCKDPDLQRPIYALFSSWLGSLAHIQRISQILGLRPLEGFFSQVPGG